MIATATGYDSADVMLKVPALDHGDRGESAEFVAMAAVSEFCEAISQSGLTRAERQQIIETALEGIARKMAPGVGLEEEHDTFVRCVRTAYHLSCTWASRRPLPEPTFAQVVEALARSASERASDTIHPYAKD